jgi:uncharacterized Tic20 family protein
MMQPPPPGYASSDEKTWALVSHFGGAAGTLVCGLLGFVAPLVAFLTKGDSSPTVRRHALAALNFQAPLNALALLLVLVSCASNALPSGLSWLISTLAWLAGLVVYVLGVVFGIIAGVKANEGWEYKYPFGFSFIK